MNRLNDILGTQLPIIQGGMANIATGEFAAACSNAGALGIIAAGGVRTTEDALNYYAVVKEVLGDEWLNQDLFRLGASSLANAVLSSLEGKEVKFF